MKLIAHRGHTDGIVTGADNKPEYIQRALEGGFDVEIDVWYANSKFWLGHDKPEYQIKESFLENEKFWCHAKNIDALYHMSNNLKIHCFYHVRDAVTLTSKGYFWTYPRNHLTEKSILLAPDLDSKKYEPIRLIDNCFGICSNYVERYKEIYG